MTDNEIVKALECCANWESDKSCEDCPANTYGFGCANKRAKYSLDLINRQKAEIAKKDTEIDILIRKKEALNDEVFGLKAEIASLNKGKTFTIEFNDEQLERLIQRYIESTKGKEGKRFGKWLFQKTYYEADECTCSLCGQRMTTQTGTRMNFCPRCGTDMKCLEGGEADA